MVNKIGAVIVKEIREALPATIFFLFLFHMIALTKAVSLSDYNMTALRATGATIGALIVAKAILVVEALPLAKLFPGRRVVQLLGKTLLYSLVVLLFRVVEELIPLASRHGGLLLAVKAMYREVSWPLFGVLAVWIVCGLFLYSLVSELVRIAGPGKVNEVLFGTHSRDSE